MVHLKRQSARPCFPRSATCVHKSLCRFAAAEMLPKTCIACIALLQCLFERRSPAARAQQGTPRASPIRKAPADTACCGTMVHHSSAGCVTCVAGLRSHHCCIHFCKARCGVRFCMQSCANKERVHASNSCTSYCCCMQEDGQ